MPPCARYRSRVASATNRIAPPRRCACAMDYSLGGLPASRSNSFSSERAYPWRQRCWREKCRQCQLYVVLQSYCGALTARKLRAAGFPDLEKRRAASAQERMQRLLAIDEIHRLLACTREQPACSNILKYLFNYREFPSVPLELVKHVCGPIALLTVSGGSTPSCVRKTALNRRRSSIDYTRFDIRRNRSHCRSPGPKRARGARTRDGALECCDLQHADKFFAADTGSEWNVSH
jgi:hypothetical protein